MPSVEVRARDRQIQIDVARSELSGWIAKAECPWTGRLVTTGGPSRERAVGQLVEALERNAAAAADDPR